MTFGKPVPGVQIVERKRKIHEEKKKRGETIWTPGTGYDFGGTPHSNQLHLLQ